MICSKCNGIGRIDNDHYYKYGCAEAYERGIDPKKRCVNCGGSGFIIGNADEVIVRLNMAIEGNEPLTIRELKEIRDLIQQ